MGGSSTKQSPKKSPKEDEKIESKQTSKTSPKTEESSGVKQTSKKRVRIVAYGVPNADAFDKSLEGSKPYFNSGDPVFPEGVSRELFIINREKLIQFIILSMDASAEPGIVAAYGKDPDDPAWKAMADGAKAAGFMQDPVYFQYMDEKELFGEEESDLKTPLIPDLGCVMPKLPGWPSSFPSIEGAVVHCCAPVVKGVYTGVQIPPTVKDSKPAPTVTDTKPVPTAKDMEAAKLLYVELQCDWTGNPDVKSIGDMKAMLGDGGATAMWSDIEGLRHKYFTYNEKKDIVCGVYVFYSQDALDKYMASELFKSHETFPHFSKVTAQVLDVMPGTELSIEKTDWKHTPAMREDVCQARMLVVDITMKYDTGVDGLPTCAADLYGFMAASPAGMGYPGKFGELSGLRGKYFAYDDKIGHCYGFYTFVDQKCLDEYMASDLFKTQGEPPHIEALAYRTHEVLPGTERSLDIGSWGA